jgi:hypothetical protein
LRFFWDSCEEEFTTETPSPQRVGSSNDFYQFSLRPLRLSGEIPQYCFTQKPEEPSLKNNQVNKNRATRASVILSNAKDLG